MAKLSAQQAHKRRTDFPESAKCGRAPFLAAAFLAGFAILMLEAIWIRRIGIAAGRTAISSALVLAAFFAASALGAWLGGRSASTVKLPGRLCGLLFAAAGVFALAGEALHIPPAANPVLFASILVAPPAFLWAAAFPCIGELFVTQGNIRTSSAGGFYTADLLGSASGVLIGGIFLPMTVGYSRASIAAACLLIFAGLLAVLGGGTKLSGTLDVAPETFSRGSGWGKAVLAASGFLSIGAETLAVQWLLLVTEESIYTVTAVLFAFVVNLSAGAALATLFRKRGLRTESLVRTSLLLSGTFAVIYPFLLKPAVGSVPWTGWDQPMTMMFKVILTTTLVSAPAVIAMGMIFPLAWESAFPLGRQGRAFGTIFCVNKIACAAGALAVPFLLVKYLGPARATIAVGTIYFLLVAMRSWRLGLAGLALAAAGMWWAPLPIHLQSGESLISLRYDVQGPVATVQDSHESRHIVVSQYYSLNGTGRALQTQRHEGWLPLVFAQRHDRVLFIGMASGISASAVLDFPVREFVTAEVLPGVADAARRDFREWNSVLFNDPRAHIAIDDGRKVLASASQPWDVVICDLMLPWAESSSSLYSLDFFKSVHERLSDDGLFCLWLPMYQMNSEIADCLLRTFAEVFPGATLIRANLDPIQPVIGLVGTRRGLDLAPVRLQKQIALGSKPELFHVSPFLKSSGHLHLALAGRSVLRPAATGLPINTDDAPSIAFNAPKAIQGIGLLRGVRLLEWLNAAAPPSAMGPELERAINAGHNYYAAEAMSIPLPDLAKQKERDMRAAYHIERAQQLWPEATLSPAELNAQIGVAQDIR